MKFHKYFLQGVALVALFSCGRIEEPGTEIRAEEVTPSEESYIPGVMTVEFSDELAAQIEAGLKSGGKIATKSAPLDDAFEAIGVTGFERVFPDAGPWEERHREAGLHRWYRVYYNGNAAARTKAPVSIGMMEGVLNAAPCPKMKVHSYFNDPLAFEQWDFNNPGGSNTTGKYAWGADIDVEPVWANYTAGSSNVIVQVVDYGVDMSHRDIGPVTIPFGPDGSRSFCPGFEDQPVSKGNHGCHCAGTIAAINNNHLGVCGIAGGNDGNGGVRILSCEIFRDEGGERLNGSGENAIVWGADHGAVISSNSWGTDFKREVDARAAKEKDYAATKVAVEYFNKHAGTDLNGNQTGPMKGGVVFFSAGNDNWQAGWPAKLDCVVAVGASTALNTKTTYSNYGDWVDICAPGGDGSINIWSCLTDGKYGAMNGTSMACPHVAGVAALLVSYFGGPGFTREMLLERLLTGASHEKVAPSQNIGPLVDAYASFSLWSTIAPEPVGDFTLESVSNKIKFTWAVTPDADDKHAGKFLLALSENASTMTEQLSPRSLPDDVISWTLPTGTKQVGDNLEWEFEGLKFETDYYCTVFASDMSGNYSAAAPVRTIRTNRNNPPVFDQVCGSPITVKAHEVTRLEFSAHDPDGHKFTLRAEPGSEAVSAPESKNGMITVAISGRDAAPGDYTCTVVATDEYGCESRYPFTYTILENHNPEATKEFEDILMSKPGETVKIDLEDYITDIDGERVVYRASSAQTGMVDIKFMGNTLNITSKKYGTADITVKASDTCGGSSEFTFRILLRDSSKPMDLYPNPVTGGILNLRPGKQMQATVTIRSKSGATVFSGEAGMSPFEPYTVDMKGLPAGIYYVTVVSAGIDSTYTIVKI